MINILKALKKFFSTPAFTDEETNRRAGLLSFIINLHIVVTLSTTLIFILFLKVPPIFPLAAFLASLPGFGLRVMVRRGYVKQASLLFVTMVILIMPLLAWFSGDSVATVPVTVFQCITVLMAGLLLGRWGAAIFVALTGMINSILIYAELQGIYITSATHTPVLSWFMQIVAFSAIAAMLYVTNRLIEGSFMRAQKENDQRRAREQELEKVIHEKTRAEAELQKFAERLEMLHEIDRALLSANSPQEITKKALARIRQLIPSPRASVTLFDFNKNEAIFLAADFDKPSTGAESVITLQEYGQYIIDELQQNKSCIVNDTRTHPTATELDRHLAEDGLPAWLYLPLLYQGQLIGALNFGRAAGNFFNAAEAEIAFGVANQLAVVIRQSRLYEDLQNELTERKQTEEKLVNSEARYRGLLENIPVITYVVELGHEPLNRATYVSPQIETVTGYASAEFLNDPLLWMELIHPEDRERVMADSDRADRTGGSFVSDYRIVNRENKTFWFHDESVLVKDKHNQPLYRLGVWTDITESKLAEFAKQQAEDLYRQAITSAGAVPYVLDHVTRGLSFIGDGILNMTGYTAFEMMNTDLWNAVVQEGFPRGNLAHLTYAEADRITNEDHSIPWECDYRILTRDGQTRWIADTSVKGFDKESEHLLSIGIKQDITERKLAEVEREAFIKELEERNAELERFNYTVSHELKSPIVTIKGFLGSVVQDLQGGKYERAQKDLLRISTAADKMHDTLSDLLELSRIGRIANPPEEVDMIQLAHEALETVHGRIQARSITIHVATDLPSVRGDRVRLREVYENLLDNAAKHFGDQPAPLIEVGIRKAGHEIVYFVKDNGLGIDAKYHKRIFGLFDKLDAASDGTGIGLALVKRIIETHGGKIWVESEGLGKGTTFCFTIPPKTD